MLMKFEFSLQILGKHSNIKFHKNPSNGSQAVLCGWTDKRRHVLKLTVSFQNFLNVPENYEKPVRTINIMGTSHIKVRALLLDPTCQIERCYNELFVLTSILLHGSLLNYAVTMNSRLT
jgi:hypothetical protein